MTFLTEAERAEDIADALSKFRASVAEEREELVSVIAELNGLSGAIRRIDELTKSKYSPNQLIVQQDLDIVLESIEFTLEDIWAQIGTIGNGAQRLTVRDYRTTWKDIQRAVAQSGKRSLTARLQLYSLFLDELGRIMRRPSVSQRQIEGLRFDVKDLLAAQDRRLIALNGAVQDLSLTPVPKRSYERERDPSSPTSSRDNSLPPWVTSPPLSPTTTFSTTFSSASMTSGSVAEMGDDHWALHVFTDLSVTRLDPSEEEAECYGEAMPDALAWLNKDNMLQVLKIAFGRQGLHVYLFVRESDHRARILCEMPERSGACWYSCMPFNKIHLRRSRSMITLYNRVSGTNTFTTWARLPFTSMERLVLFYNTCLALRSHDTHKRVSEIADHELYGEICPFAGEICDDDYRHALRIYRDHYSKAIRLQASILTGQMKHTPIWTAFITDNILSHDWMRLEGRRTICLRSLKRHIFAPRYTPPMLESGEHMLEFIRSCDARDFMESIDDLAEAYRK